MEHKTGYDVACPTGFNAAGSKLKETSRFTANRKGIASERR